MPLYHAVFMPCDSFSGSLVFLPYLHFSLLVGIVMDRGLESRRPFCQPRRLAYLVTNVRKYPTGVCCTKVTRACRVGRGKRGHKVFRFSHSGSSSGTSIPSLPGARIGNDPFNTHAAPTSQTQIRPCSSTEALAAH